MTTNNILKICCVISLGAMIYHFIPEPKPKEESAPIIEPEDPFVFKESHWFDAGIKGTNGQGELLIIELKLNRDGSVIWRVKPKEELKDL